MRVIQACVRIPHSRQAVLGILFLVVSLSGCGNKYASSSSSLQNILTIVAPSTTVSLGGTLQFTAKVAGTSVTPTWSVVSGPGTISASGIYTAPVSMPANKSATIGAAITGISGSPTQTITFTDAGTISVSAPPATVDTNQSVQFTATIGQSSGTPVWTVTGAGSISQAGVYTAPITLPSNHNVTVTATLSTDSSISASQSFTLVAIPAISIAAPSSTVAINAPLQFTATVMGIVDQVNWAVSGGGSISATGLYTAPASVPNPATVTITASLLSQGSVKATGTATVVAAPTIVSALPASLPTGQNNVVTLTGTGFIPGVQVIYNNEPAPTSYINATTLQVTLSADPSFVTESYPASGTIQLIARNPGPGGTSAGFNLPVTPAATTFASVGSTPVLSIPTGFIGLSHEIGDGQWTMGDLQRGANVAYRKLLSNLMDTPNSPFLIRIGGGTTDNTVNPNNELPMSVEEFNELHAAVPSITFSLGVILGPNSNTSGNSMSVPTYADNTASNYVATLDPGVLDSLEIGNEVDNYQYSGGTNYTFDAYLGNYNAWASSILNIVYPQAPKFTGPSLGTLRPLTNNSYWSGFRAENPSYLQIYAGDVKDINKVISVHYYSGMTGGLPASYLLGYPLAATGSPAVVPPTALQYQNPGQTPYFWVPSLMGWAAGVAHQNGMNFRINEMNTVDGGGQPGASDTFAASLWTVDTLFELAANGVDGVNFHGANGGLRNVVAGTTCKVQNVTYNAPCTPTPIYAPFSFNIQHSATSYPLIYTLDSVNPLYYGLYFFHLAVPDNSKLLPVSVQTPSYLKVWATQAPDGSIRVALINKDITFSGDVQISLPGRGSAQSLVMKTSNTGGYSGSLMYADNTTEVGTTGITIGGQTWDGSTDGTIQGTATVTSIAPSNGVYTVSVQPTSAVLLTIQQ